MNTKLEAGMGEGQINAGWKRERFELCAHKTNINITGDRLIERAKSANQNNLSAKDPSTPPSKP